jgi:glycerol uptake facilitator-like aquaporin
MNAAMGRRLLAEFTGTGLLVAVVVGPGTSATRLTADGALGLLVNSVATALGLAVLIVIFIQASGAYFNPIITAADWLLGRRPPRRYGPGLAAAVMACQIVGFTASTAFANPAVTIGQSLTNTYAGVAPASVPAFIAAQLGGGAMGTLLAVAIYPARRGRTRAEQPARLAL